MSIIDPNPALTFVRNMGKEGGGQRVSEDGKLKKAANSLAGQYIERICKDEIISQDTIFKLINFICWSVRSGKMDIYPGSPPDAPGSQPAEPESFQPGRICMYSDFEKHEKRLDALEKKVQEMPDHITSRWADVRLSIMHDLERSRINPLEMKIDALEKKVDELQTHQRVYDGMRLEKLENEVKVKASLSFAEVLDGQLCGLHDRLNALEEKHRELCKKVL